MAADSIIGAELMPSPYAEVCAELDQAVWRIDDLQRELAAAREALREVVEAGDEVIQRCGNDTPAYRSAAERNHRAWVIARQMIAAAPAAPKSPDAEDAARLTKACGLLRAIRDDYTILNKICVSSSGKREPIVDLIDKFFDDFDAARKGAK